MNYCDNAPWILTLFPARSRDNKDTVLGVNHIIPCNFYGKVYLGDIYRRTPQATWHPYFLPITLSLVRSAKESLRITK